MIFNSVKNKGITPSKYDQISARAGIWRFGKEAVAAMIKDFAQLDAGAFPGKPVVEPIRRTDLTEEERS